MHCCFSSSRIYDPFQCTIAHSIFTSNYASLAVQCLGWVGQAEAVAKPFLFVLMHFRKCCNLSHHSPSSIYAPYHSLHGGVSKALHNFQQCFPSRDLWWRRFCSANPIGRTRRLESLKIRAKATVRALASGTESGETEPSTLPSRPGGYIPFEYVTFTSDQLTHEVAIQVSTWRELHALSLRAFGPYSYPCSNKVH